MKVASKELCDELYKLSGWKDEWFYAWGGETLFTTIAGAISTPSDIPAYDLGYLMRKLPKKIGTGSFLHLTYPVNLWLAGYTTNVDYVTVGKVSFDHMQTADTPEDAACKLAIELFKQGILGMNDKLPEHLLMLINNMYWEGEPEGGYQQGSAGESAAYLLSGYKPWQIRRDSATSSKPCHECDGTGYEDSVWDIRCRACKGTGCVKTRRANEEIS